MFESMENTITTLERYVSIFKDYRDVMEVTWPMTDKNILKLLREKYTELGAEIEAIKELSNKDMEDMFELCTQE